MLRKSIRCKSKWAVILALASPYISEAQEAIPKPYAIERYQPVWENSPFEIETPPPPPKPKVEPQFAKNLVVAGVLEIGEITNVTIRDRSSGQYFELGPKKSYQGIKLVEVIQNEDLIQVEVTVSKGKAKATIGYDTKMAKGPAQGPSVGGGGGPGISANPAVKGLTPNRLQNAGLQNAISGAKGPNNAQGQSPTSAGTVEGAGAGSGNGTKKESNNNSQGGPQKTPEQPVPRKPPTPKERLKIVIPGPLS